MSGWAVDTKPKAPWVRLGLWPRFCMWAGVRMPRSKLGYRLQCLAWAAVDAEYDRMVDRGDFK
jgi:hypothetical protein